MQTRQNTRSRRIATVIAAVAAAIAVGTPIAMADHAATSFANGYDTSPVVSDGTSR